MKSNIFQKVLDCTEVEIKCKYQTTVDRMCEMQGEGHKTNYNNCSFVFFCNKKGYFRVTTSQRGSYTTYGVEGRVVEENGKTKAKIYSVYNRSCRFYEIFLYSAVILCLIGTVVGLFMGEDMFGNAGDFYKFLLAVPLIIILIATSFKEEKSSADTLEKMKQEVLGRINAVERWDD